MLTATRMLVAMVVVMVVMMTVMIMIVMMRRMTMTMTKYGLRDRGHELFYRLISRKKNRSRLPTKDGGPGGPCLGPGRRVADNPGCLCRGIGRVLVTVLKGVLVGYWWVLVGIGGYRNRTAGDRQQCGIGGGVGHYIEIFI